MTAAQKHEFTGRHLLLIMVAFFAVVIGVNAALAVFAARGWSGLVVENSYVASQNYNREIALRREQAALGWGVAVNTVDGTLELEVRSPTGEPVTGLAIELDAARPTDERADRRVGVTPLGQGRYRADTPLQTGAWNIAVQMARGSDRATARLRVTIPAQP